MAITVLLTPKITVAGTDLTNHISQITIEETAADVDTTAFGSSAKTRTGGLQDNKVTLVFQQDFAASSVDATISGLLGTLATITVLPINGATSSTNPSRTFSALINDWKSIDGKVGDLLTSSISWPISGAVTKSNT